MQRVKVVEKKMGASCGQKYTASLPSVTEERFSSLSSSRLTTLPSANLPQYLLTFNIIYIFNIYYGDEKERTPRRGGVWVGSDFVLEKIIWGG